MKKRIEIEVRTFISLEQYKNLEKKLKKNSRFLKEIKDETIYFRGQKDLRIRRDNESAYLILKSGKIHQDFRNEIEIKLKRRDFKPLKDLLEKLGFKIEINWFRKRKIYNFKGVKVFLDNTKGYGRIVELEKIGNEKNKEKIFNDLKSKLLSLGIKNITSKKEFDKKFKYFKKNWKKLIK
jgi:predicted adenylyl cyclase CyaB